MKPKIYIGSGDESILERKVLIYSIIKNSSIEFDINVFDGTKNSLITSNRNINLDSVFPYQSHNKTEFSLYRFLIPLLNNFSDRAIYLDSDTLSLHNINTLLQLDMGENSILCKRDELYGNWSTSVMLLDCKKCKLNLDKIMVDLDANLYTYEDVMGVSKNFVQRHNIKVGELCPKWNQFDSLDANTKILHYTDLGRQPWLHPDHKFSGIWFDYFIQARKSKYVLDSDVQTAVEKNRAHKVLLYLTNKYYLIIYLILIKFRLSNITFLPGLRKILRHFASLKF